MNSIRDHWDRWGGWILIAAGAVALVLGWVGVSGTIYPAEQLAYLASGGLGGLFLLGLGATLLLSADLRDEWIAIDDLRATIAAGAAASSPPAADVATAGGASTASANGYHDEDEARTTVVRLGAGAGR